mmetsp:Transcript_6529/g.18687  ORF Transcript_6529/g.18687 Transcript_6529/m.18687 type:complete len:189 (+) Transcript_6529:2-568(+)
MGNACGTAMAAVAAAAAAATVAPPGIPFPRASEQSPDALTPVAPGVNAPTLLTREESEALAEAAAALSARQVSAPSPPEGGMPTVGSSVVGGVGAAAAQAAGADTLSSIEKKLDRLLTLFDREVAIDPAAASHWSAAMAAVQRQQQEALQHHGPQHQQHLWQHGMPYALPQQDRFGGPHCYRFPTELL